MKRPIISGIFALALVGLFGGEAAAIELVVVESRGVNLTPGQTVDGGKPISLRQGQHVTLLASNGQIVKLEGPSEAAPDSQIQGAGGTDVSSAMAALVTERQARTSEVGVVRGAGEVKLPDPWVVDITHPGTSCVQAGRPAVLWRSDEMGAVSVTISPADRSWAFTQQWPAAADRLTMSPKLPLKDQTSYVVNVGGKLAPVTLRVIPATVSNDAMRAGWMTQVGCENQADALLATLRK